MEYIAVLLPSVVVGLIFWFAMKSIFNADKSERQAEARVGRGQCRRSGRGCRRVSIISPSTALPTSSRPSVSGPGETT